MVKTRRFKNGKKSRGRLQHKRHKHHSTHRRKVKRHSRRGTKRRRRERTKRVKRGGTRKCMMKGGAYYVITYDNGDKTIIDTGRPTFKPGTKNDKAIEEKLNLRPEMQDTPLSGVTMIESGKYYTGYIGDQPVTINRYRDAAAADAANTKEMMAKKIFQKQGENVRASIATQKQLRRAMEKKAGMRSHAKHVPGEAAAADDDHSATIEAEGQSQTSTTNFGQGAMAERD